MRPSGPETVWCLLNLSMAWNFFWVRVGMIWNQASLGAPARTRYEATRDGVRAPQGGPQGSGRCSTQGAPPLCAGWPPGIGSSVNKGNLSYAQRPNSACDVGLPLGLTSGLGRDRGESGGLTGVLVAPARHRENLGQLFMGIVESGCMLVRSRELRWRGKSGGQQGN